MKLLNFVGTSLDDLHNFPTKPAELPALNYMPFNVEEVRYEKVNC